MILRPARLEDEPAIFALTERLADFPLPPGRTAREIALADNPIIHAQLTDPKDDALCVVADAGDEGIAGVIFANTRRDYFNQSLVAYIEVLAVEKAAAGRGVARRLMEAVEVWARQRGMPTVELSVFAANVRARGFYEHLGYQPEFIRYAKRIRPAGG
jgi:ribosomal protein S18 acetylase RimI-like enzyme